MRERAVMTGKHKPQVHTVPMRIPQQRGPRPVGIVDAGTRVEHLVPGDVLAPHHLSHLANCGSPTHPQPDRRGSPPTRTAHQPPVVEITEIIFVADRYEL
jgi:hypothetical protein